MSTMSLCHCQIELGLCKMNGVNDRERKRKHKTDCETIDSPDFAIPGGTKFKKEPVGLDLFFLDLNKFVKSC